MFTVFTSSRFQLSLQNVSINVQPELETGRVTGHVLRNLCGSGRVAGQPKFAEICFENIRATFLVRGANCYEDAVLFVCRQKRVP